MRLDIGVGCGNGSLVPRLGLNKREGVKDGLGQMVVWAKGLAGKYTTLRPVKECVLVNYCLRIHEIDIHFGMMNIIIIHMRRNLTLRSSYTGRPASRSSNPPRHMTWY